MNRNLLSTGKTPTWCPGCFNFQILEGFKKFISEKKKKDNLAMVTGIGCHAKIFDYVNLNGINTLHGRVLPTCLGVKIGNPNLSVFGFSGDGDAYAEGMEHLIHAARYNANINYIIHNNQVFALTVSQPTPTTEMGFKDKTNPDGVKTHPINPIKIMLAAGATFIARVFADVEQIEYILGEAEKHKGFSFIEVIQPCIIFHPDKGYKEKMYSLDEVNHDRTNFEQAWKRAEEFDYDKIDEKTKIPLGVFYQNTESESRVFEEQFLQITELKKDKKSWKDIRR